MGYFSKRIYCQLLSKLPNLVTLSRCNCYDLDDQCRTFPGIGGVSKKQKIRCPFQTREEDVGWGICHKSFSFSSDAGVVAAADEVEDNGQWQQRRQQVKHCLSADVHWVRFGGGGQKLKGEVGSWLFIRQIQGKDVLKDVNRR